MRESAEDAAPKTAAQPPHSQFIREQGDIRSLRAHIDQSLACVRFLISEVNGPPLGACPEAVNIEMIAGLDRQLLRRLIEGNIAIRAK